MLKQKMLVGATALALVFGLAGCASDKSEEPAVEPETPEVVEPTEPELTPEEQAQLELIAATQATVDEQMARYKAWMAGSNMEIYNDVMQIMWDNDGDTSDIDYHDMGFPTLGVFTTMTNNLVEYMHGNSDELFTDLSTLGVADQGYRLYYFLMEDYGVTDFKVTAVAEFDASTDTVLAAMDDFVSGDDYYRTATAEASTPHAITHVATCEDGYLIYFEEGFKIIEILNENSEID